MAWHITPFSALSIEDNVIRNTSGIYFFVNLTKPFAYKIPFLSASWPIEDSPSQPPPAPPALHCVPWKISCIGLFYTLSPIASYYAYNEDDCVALNKYFHKLTFSWSGTHINWITSPRNRKQEFPGQSPALLVVEDR